MPPKLISDALASDDSAMSILREVGIDFPLYAIGDFKGTVTQWVGEIFNSTSYLYAFQQRHADSFELSRKIEDPSKIPEIAKAMNVTEGPMKSAISRMNHFGLYSPRLILIVLLTAKWHRINPVHPSIQDTQQEIDKLQKQIDAVDGKIKAIQQNASFSEIKKDKLIKPLTEEKKGLESAKSEWMNQRVKLQAEKLRELFGLTLKEAKPQILLNTAIKTTSDTAMNVTELQQRIVTIEKANPKTAVKRPKYNPEEGIVYTDGSVLWKDRYAVFSVWNPTRKEAVTGKVDASVPSVQAEGMAVMLALESWAALIKIIRTDSKDLVEAVERVSPGLSSEDRNQLKVPIAADIKDEITRHNIKLEWVSRSNREQSIADRMCDEARIEGHYGHWSVTVDWDLPSTSDEFFKATPKRRKTTLTAIPGGGVDPIAEAIQGLAKQEQVMVSAIAELEAKLQNLRNQLPEIEQNKRVLEQAKAVMEQVGRD